MRIVVTGSAGSLAGDVIPGLLHEGHDVHGVDRVDAGVDTAVYPQKGETPQGQFSRTVLDLNDSTERDRHFTGADAIIHLSGIPLEDEWQNLVEANINATYAVLNTALRCGVSRVVIASSIHAVGLTPIPMYGRLLDASILARPNTLYGASKVAAEGLGSYFAEQHGLEIANLRICSRMQSPQSERHLSTWLSPGDAARLCAAAVTAVLPENFWSVWGVSKNTRTWFDLSAGHAIGYQPEDDAETFSKEVFSRPKDSSQSHTTIGGEFSSANPPSMTKA